MQIKKGRNTMRKLAKVLIVLVFAIAIIAAVTSCGCDHENTELRGKKAATCTSTGYTGDEVCLDCGEIVEDGEGTTIPKRSHTYDEGVVTKNPSCISEGTLTKTCTVCNNTKQEAIAKVAHQEIYHDALDGTHNITCYVCTHNVYGNHTPVDSGVAVEATCTERPYTLMTCKDCGGSYKEYGSGSALNHSFSEWETSAIATCASTGVKSRSCTRCGESEYIEVPANSTAHEWNAGVQIAAASCTAEGTRLLSCNNCSATKEVAIPKCAHSYVDSDSDGSGWVNQVCNAGNCGATRTYFDASTLKSAELEVEKIPTGSKLELGMENATITIPADVVEQIKGSSGSNVTVKAEFVDETNKNTLLSSNKLTPDQKSRLEGEEIYDFGISGVSSFDAAVTVTIPYILKDGEDADGIVIWYVKNDGQVEEVSATYNATTETVTFSVEHFSFYAVAYQETQAMKCRRGVHDFVTTGKTVAATCESFGYTVYECTHCHVLDLGNFVEKKDHAWGEVKDPVVTCTEGGYKYRECSKCGAHLESTYVRAKGHTVTATPTCTTGASCTTCNSIVKPALGHDYSEWTIVKEPTATAEGLKTRSCLNCGEKFEVAIAKEGAIEAAEFNSIEDMYAFIFTEFFGVNAGTLSFEFDLPTETMKVSGTFAFTTEPMTFSFWAEMKETYSNGETYTEPVGMYYDGKTAYVCADGDLMITDLVAMMECRGADFETIFEILTALYDYINPEVERVVKLANDILAVLPDDVATELREYVDAITNVYAYYSVRLGLDTNVKIKENSEVLSAKDIVIFLDAIMEKTESGGTVTYTFGTKNLTDALDEAIAFLKDNEKKAIGDVLFDLNKELLGEMFGGAKSFDELISYLRREFPGTQSLNDTVSKLLKIAISQNMTLKDVYEVVDLILAYAGTAPTDNTGKPISFEEMLKQQMDLSMKLDDFIGAFMEEGMTMSAIIDMVAEMGKSMTLGDTEIPEYGMTVSEMLPQISAITDSVKPTISVEIKLGANGFISSANVSFSAAMVDPDTKAETVMASGSLTFAASATVKAPEAIKDYTSAINVTSKVEANGNVTVSGLPKDAEVSVNLESSYSPSFADLKAKGYLVKDNDLSSTYGTTVYKLDPKFSGSSSHLQTLYYVNGKYYTTTWFDISTPAEVIDKVNVSEFLENPEAYLPDANDEAVGYIEMDNGSDIPVYLTVGGLVYKQNEEWFVVNASESYISYSYRYENGVEKRILCLYEYDLDSAPYSDFFANVSIDSIYGTGYRWFNNYYAFESYYGSEFYNSLVCISIANVVDYADWGVSAYVFGVIENDEIFFVTGTRGYTTSARMTLSEAQPPEGYTHFYSYDTEVWHNDKLVKAKEIDYYVANPRYYIEVDTGVYVDIQNDGLTPVGALDSFETKALPNGKTLYVKGYDGEYIYGYVKVTDTLFAQAYLNQSTNEVVYRNGSTGAYTNIRNVVDVEGGIVYNADGTVTIKKALIDEIKALIAGSENAIFLFYVDARIEDDNDLFDRIEIQTPVYYEVPELEFDINDIMGSVGGSSSYVDWYSWFGYSYGFNVVPNGDGTVSIYSSRGDKIDFSIYSNGGFPVDDFVTRDESYTDLPIYYMNQVNEYGTDYVKIGNKYYYYNTYSDYNATFYSSAADIKASKFVIQELTYYIPAVNPNDSTELDVFYGTVYIEGLNYNISRYFVIDDGILYVLTGAKQISEYGIEYEGMMKASEYFSKLKITVDTGNYWGYTEDYVNGVKKSIYYVRASVTEPASVNGKEDLVISDNSVRAVKNGSYFAYLKTYDYAGKHYLEVGDTVTIPQNYIVSGERSSAYTNGTFTIVNFKYSEMSKSEYIEIGGDFYHYYWNATHDEYSFKENFYEKKTLYMGTREDGTTQLLEGDYWGELYPYYGDLDPADADKINNMGNYYHGEYVSITEYVFYLYNNENIYTSEIGGDEIYVDTNNMRAYVKVANGRYVQGELIQTEKSNRSLVYIDGFAYYFSPYNFNYASLSTSSIKESDAFKEVVQITNNGTVIVIHEEILDLFDGDFHFNIYGSSNSYTLHKNELLSLFDRADEIGGGSYNDKYYVGGLVGEFTGEVIYK